MPADEYERIFEEKFGDAGYEDPPNDDDAFDMYQIDGAGDGDYPLWLAASMHAWIPSHLLLKFGRQTASTLNGDHWDIDEANAEAIADELRSLGYTVEKSDLEYWC